ncbi:lipase family protein [Undibacterium sp. TS12]|uniref:lipase family protein n=1 Tax=Undibacterium sp. TS12 TaxID=2908202 RepID=UPI001F4D29DA|nr:lipase family protein [Undibacterium sp. TS12]MCH8620492.1 lipase family protein [Undibacterium sp. TS12]
MSHDTAYDPSKTALFHPEEQPALLGEDLPWTTHALCAELARLAYWRFEASANVRDKLAAVLAQAGFAVPVFFVNADSGTQCFATSKAGSVYVAFRGTQPDDPTDVLTDALFLPVQWQGPGRVHDGFLRAYNSVAAALDDWLAGQPATSRVYLTGHSLGAALATLAAACTNGSHLVTFGSPRVGDAAFVAAFTGRAVDRYVNCTDIVTSLPPESEYYEHVRGLHYLNRHARLIVAASELDILQDQTIARAEYLLEYSWKSANVGFRSLADHAPVNYVRAVLNL